MSLEGTTGFSAADDFVHTHDPDVWGWNESFLLSWLGSDEEPAGLFRLGLLPNQGRGWLWFFLYHEGEWLAIEEPRLDLRHFDLGAGARCDAWGLRFAWTPIEPLATARFSLEGVAAVRSGARAGALVPLEIELNASATTPCFGTGTGGEAEEQPRYPASRFEQSVVLDGRLTVGDRSVPIACPGHRDRSWGPRTWQRAYTLGDLQGDDFQLYFASAPDPNLRGGGYLRDDGGVRTLTSIDGAIDYDDVGHTLGPSRLRFTTDGGDTMAVELAPVSPSICFDMAHSCDPPEHWSYWRTLVSGRVVDSGATFRGWFEANRYGLA